MAQEKVSSNEIKNKKVELQKKLEQLRDRDREKVRGVFRFHEVPGGSMKFPFRQYKEDQIETYTLTDGQIYEIPMGLARHLNKNCWYPIHSHQLDSDGRASRIIGKKVSRCSFQSLDFMDAETLREIGDPAMPDRIVTY